MKQMRRDSLGVENERGRGGYQIKLMIEEPPPSFIESFLTATHRIRTYIIFMTATSLADSRGYASLRNICQGQVAKAALLATHRKYRERAPPPGMMLNHDISIHEWVSEIN
jgi:hypothetical protein